MGTTQRRASSNTAVSLLKKSHSSRERCVPRVSGRAPDVPTSPAGSPPIPRAAPPSMERRGGGVWWWYAIGKKGRNWRVLSPSPRGDEPPVTYGARRHREARARTPAARASRGCRVPLPVVTSRVIRWCVVVVCNWEEGALGDWEVAQVMLRRQLTNRGVTPGDPALGRAIRWAGNPLAFYPRLGRVENADKKTTRRRGRAEPSGVDPGAGAPQPPAL